MNKCLGGERMPKDRKKENCAAKSELHRVHLIL
jgi:hypothetical protein